MREPHCLTSQIRLRRPWPVQSLAFHSYPSHLQMSVNYQQFRTGTMTMSMLGSNKSNWNMAKTFGWKIVEIYTQLVKGNCCWEWVSLYKPPWVEMRRWQLGQLWPGDPGGSRTKSVLTPGGFWKAYLWIITRDQRERHGESVKERQNCMTRIGMMQDNLSGHNKNENDQKLMLSRCESSCHSFT